MNKDNEGVVDTQEKGVREYFCLSEQHFHKRIGKMLE